MKVDAPPSLDISHFTTPKGYTYTGIPWELKMKEVVSTLERLTEELEAIHNRLLELEKSEAERSHVERLTAAAYGLPVGSRS